MKGERFYARNRVLTKNRLYHAGADFWLPFCSPALSGILNSALSRIFVINPDMDGETVSKKLIIKFLNGSECQGHLFQPFDPEGAGVEIFRPGEDRPISYPFEAICFVKLLTTPTRMCASTA